MRGELSRHAERRGDNEKVVLCLEGILVTMYTRMWPQEETVTVEGRGNQVRNGQVTQQIIILKTPFLIPRRIHASNFGAKSNH